MSDGIWTATMVGATVSDRYEISSRASGMIERVCRVQGRVNAARICSTLNALEDRVADAEEANFDLRTKVAEGYEIEARDTKIIARKDALLRECRPYIEDSCGWPLLTAIDAETGKAEAAGEPSDQVFECRGCSASAETGTLCNCYREKEAGK